MLQIIIAWYRRYFSDPDAIILFLSLVVAFIILLMMGRMLAPVIASIVIAYLLEAVVVRLERLRCPHAVAVIIVYLAFLGLLIFGILGLLPILWHQMSNLSNEMPNMVTRGQAILSYLPERYPDFISLDQVITLLGEFRVELARFGQIALAATLATIPNLIVIVVYLILVPLLIYFFLMDRRVILQWLQRYLPKNRRLLAQVWDEVHEQIGNYVRGKVMEVIIVGLVCYLAFGLMGLPYAALLGALVGLSVIVPYIGAVVVTVPIVIIALLQWGLSAHFAYFMLTYAIIVTLDANILVPVLFSGAVSLHPVAIIVAILFFGGLWGFWGIFFAIPLASLVKAVLSAWPTSNSLE